MHFANATLESDRFEMDPKLMFLLLMHLLPLPPRHHHHHHHCDHFEWNYIVLSHFVNLTFCQLPLCQLALLHALSLTNVPFHQPLLGPRLKWSV